MVAHFVLLHIAYLMTIGIQNIIVFRVNTIRWCPSCKNHRIFIQRPSRKLLVLNPGNFCQQPVIIVYSINTPTRLTISSIVKNIHQTIIRSEKTRRGKTCIRSINKFNSIRELPRRTHTFHRYSGRYFCRY